MTTAYDDRPDADFHALMADGVAYDAASDPRRLTNHVVYALVRLREAVPLYREVAECEDGDRRRTIATHQAETLAEVLLSVWREPAQLSAHRGHDLDPSVLFEVVAALQEGFLLQIAPEDEVDPEFVPSPELIEEAYQRPEIQRLWP